MRSVFVLFAFLALNVVLRAQSAVKPGPATKESPVYATYAAAMERSEFTVDEGYHFQFYLPDRGAAFVTDNAGDWCLGFRQGSKYAEAVKDFARQPVLTESYGDLVKYYFYPFDSIRVDVTFLVQSSRLALQDITLCNEGTQKTSVEVLPFLNHTTRAFNNVQRIAGRNAFAFSHDELPDDWVLEHGIPYVQDVHDVFMLSSAPDRMGSFRSYRWGGVQIPQEISLRKKPLYLVWGRIAHANGEPCRHRPPATTLTVTLNGNTRTVLTENAPRWGSAESNISDYGYYGIELGNLGPVGPGDHFSVRVRCTETNEEIVAEGTVGDTAKARDLRVDVTLAKGADPVPPVRVRRDIWGSGTELRLYWEKGPAGTTYRVYRRDYLAGGAYELLGDGIEQTFFTDKNIPDDKVYGYVVLTVNGGGAASSHSNEVNNIEGSDYLTDVKYPGQGRGDARELVRVVAMAKTLVLDPGGSQHLRVIRGVRRPEESQDDLLEKCERLMKEDLQPYVEAGRELFGRIPGFSSGNPDHQMLYSESFKLMRQVMLPPEGKSHFNYYVFSREPQWGWGHGGQVFHESLTMLAYALMDPLSAMNSQRVYRERQHEDGYINYRTGPYLDETIPYAGQLTTSAPWYAWVNWQLYKVSRDRTFLQEMYESSAALYRYYVKNRDADGDGLCEWGAHAVLECVRDGRVAVWDEVGWPSNFEALDLNCMLVQEARSLAAMAKELGRAGDAEAWLNDAQKRTRKINATFWDEMTGFYYNVNMKDHSFTFNRPNDLKRQEIIGFLPLWAGVADSAKAKRLVQVLTDPSKFWRKYGVPSLAADDPYYNPKGYWNGPVWVEWEYLIERGLLDYGYRAEAKELVNRIADNMIAQLKKDHNFWEFYSPDDQWAGYHKVYLWAGMISLMMKDVEEK